MEQGFSSRFSLWTWSAIRKAPGWEAGQTQTEAVVKARISDTAPPIQEVVLEGYRKMTPQEKMRRVTELNRAVMQLALARIRLQYGDISEREQQLRLASLWLDRQTMLRVFQWDPRQKGY